MGLISQVRVLRYTTKEIIEVGGVHIYTKPQRKPLKKRDEWW